MWRFSDWRIAIAVVALAGCGGAERPVESAPGNAPRPAANVALQIAVVNDAELGTAISKLRGEWHEKSGGELDVDEITIDEALSANNADLIVFPSRYLGELCEANRLRPMRPSILESQALDFGDILPLVREREIVYGQRVMALPLGCPTPLVASMAADRGAFASPLEGQHAAFAFLARVAPLAWHPSRGAIWFDPDTMKPRLTEPPFVQALSELAETESKDVSVCELAGRLLQRNISAALVWPCRSSAGRGGDTLVVRPLPSVRRVYNPAAGQWEATPPRQVTLLATSGRLIGVSTSSRNAASAFRLAGWLAGPEVAGQLGAASDGVAICRASQRSMADDWLSGDRSSHSDDFSEQVAAALSQREGVVVPRLPGVDRYLDSLGVWVRAAASGSVAPAEALAEAVREWEQLTDELGRDHQRLAYRRCLGMEP